MGFIRNHLYIFCAFALLLCSCVIVKNTPAADNALNPKAILTQIQEVTGPLPLFKNLPSFNIEFKDSVLGKGYKRYTLQFTVAPGETLPALLYVPERKTNTEKLPAIVVLHSTDASGKMVLSGGSPKTDRAFGLELAERGYVVIAPDYPGFGELKDYDFKTDRYESGTMKGIFNHIRCVDLLQSLPYVDSSRIGALGHSLGGHNAIFLAAFDQRIKVTVASSGWTLFTNYDAGKAVTKKHGGKLGPWAQEVYMPLIKTKYNLDAKKIPFDFDDVIAAIAPRAFFTNSPLHDANFDVTGVQQGMQHIQAVYKKMNAENNLRAAYPEAKHDFPKPVRREAYKFIDSVLNFVPVQHELHQ